MMGLDYMNLMSIPAILFLGFDNTVTFFKFFCLSGLSKDCNGQMRLKLNGMKLMVINCQKDIVLNQTIFQYIQCCPFGFYFSYDQPRV